ncbi:MAG: protein-tyrosine-phosphatase/tRNA A37 threonylcarbamoyladenosine synthetase subunit TsaC/SUA5/YrdC [Myxococcota bacterium]
MSNLAFDLYTADGLQTAIKLLEAGEVIALPTDTVAGLVVTANSPTAADKLSALKNSAPNKAYSWHIGSLQALQKSTPSLPAGIHPWLLEVLQKQSTVILPSSFFAIDKQLDWQHPQVGLRWPQNIDFQNVAKQIASPLFATSINESGQQPLVGEEMIAWLEAREIPYAMQLHDCPPTAKASAVIEVFPQPKVLRGDADLDIAEHIGLSILMLCTGNTCRSPLAVELLKAEIASSWQVKVDALKDFGWNIESAGTFAIEGQEISENSRLVAAEIGIDLAGHRSQSLATASQSDWDIVLGMSHNHLSALSADTPAALFDLSGGEISDPFGGDSDCYRDTRQQLKAAAQQWVRELSSWPNA